MSDRYAREPAQVSALREALQKCRDHIVLHDDEGLAIHSDLIQAADAALTATESTAAECRKQVVNETLEKAAKEADYYGNNSGTALRIAKAIRAMKG